MIIVCSLRIPIACEIIEDDFETTVKQKHVMITAALTGAKMRSHAKGVCKTSL